MKTKLFILILLAFSPIALFSDYLVLRENLSRAKTGDYLVTVRNKNYTVLLIQEKKDDSLIVHEITIPGAKFPSWIPTWRSWVESGAPNHTAWMAYKIDLRDGRIENMYSFTHQSWMNLSETDNLFTKLINLPFQPLPMEKRRYVGTSDGSRRLWHPRMVVDGRIVPGVYFDAWAAKWPNDGSDMSSKLLHIYIPQESERYPSYFPYWMRVKAMAGKTNIRIADSGSGLSSPCRYP
jgi:hypothetical protein